MCKLALMFLWTHTHTHIYIYIYNFSSPSKRRSNEVIMNIPWGLLNNEHNETTIQICVTKLENVYPTELLSAVFRLNMKRRQSLFDLMLDNKIDGCG